MMILHLSGPRYQPLSCPEGIQALPRRAQTGSIGINPSSKGKPKPANGGTLSRLRQKPRHLSGAIRGRKHTNVSQITPTRQPS